MEYDMIISEIENISDPLTLNQTGVVSGIFRAAEEAVAAGRQVILRREFTNAPPQVIQVFKTVEEIHQWRSNLNEGQKLLGRPLI